MTLGEFVQMLTLTLDSTHSGEHYAELSITVNVILLIPTIIIYYICNYGRPPAMLAASHSVSLL